MAALVFQVVVPKIRKIHNAMGPIPTSEVPGMEYSGPPILKPKTSETLTKTAEELDLWRADLEKARERQLVLDQDLLRREELIKNERAALNVEREKAVELQHRMEELLKQHKKEIDERMLKINQDETANLTKMADLFSQMKIEQNIELLRGMPDDQIAKLMALTKVKRQAKLLETWSKLHATEVDRILKITEAMKRFSNDTASSG